MHSIGRLGRIVVVPNGGVVEERATSESEAKLKTLFLELEGQSGVDAAQIGMDARHIRT